MSSRQLLPADIAGGLLGGESGQFEGGALGISSYRLSADLPGGWLVTARGDDDDPVRFMLWDPAAQGMLAPFALCFLLAWLV